MLVFGGPVERRGGLEEPGTKLELIVRSKVDE
jgi:hypothetical protein